MEVTNYTALLGYLETEQYRWNAFSSLGTQAVVTYSFYESDTLPAVSGGAAGHTEYWSFDQAQRYSFRAALDRYEEAAGLIFVEVDGPAMINAYGYDRYNSTAGYAYYPYVTETYTSSGDLAIGNGDFSIGGGQFDTILHEIGHAVGLAHPHDGDLTLADSVDTRANTVMTYNWGTGSDLGVFDLQALEHLYGSSDAFDGWSVTGGGEDAVRIRANRGDNTILAVDVDTIIIARGGADTVQGRDGNDAIKGGGGRDELNGGGGNDVLRGGGANDNLIGADGDDRLIGNRGRDVLTGGDGDDVLTGGGGADVFVFTDADFFDSNTITDFKSGVDQIDLSGIDPQYIGELEVTQTETGTTLSYYSWFEIELTEFTGSLAADDILYV